MRLLNAVLLSMLWVTSAEAGLQLHSMRCTSNSLTLDLIFVANNQNVPEATNPNGKGLFYLRANDAQGTKILNSRHMIEYAYLAYETWPTGTSLRSYSNGGKGVKALNLNLANKKELDEELSKTKPLLYYLAGSPESMSGDITFYRGNKVKWNTCEIDYNNSMDLHGELKDYSFESLREALYCPRQGTKEENSFIISHSQNFRRRGIMHPCLNRIINRELSTRGKSTKDLDREKLDEVVVDLMSKAAKAELGIQ